jgi:hypothetical protein
VNRVDFERPAVSPAFLLPAADRCCHFQLSVDGFHAALEIDSRSSYVPSLITGV